MIKRFRFLRFQGTLLVWIPLLMLEAAIAQVTAATTVGQAYDLDTQEPLYSETHCLSEDTLTRWVAYTDPAGELIASKYLRYGSSPMTPSFVQKSYYSKQSISVQLNEKAVTMSVATDGRSAPDRVVAIEPKNSLPVVIDAGFDAFVTHNWDALLAGESKSFQFPFAARESLVELRIRQAACSYDDAADKCFRLEMNSWLLRAIVDPIELGYDATQRRLTRYRGLSNIGDDDGNGMIVDIRYEYEDMPAVSCDYSELALAESPSGTTAP